MCLAFRLLSQKEFSGLENYSINFFFSKYVRLNILNSWFFWSLYIPPLIYLYFEPPPLIDQLSNVWCIFIRFSSIYMDMNKP